jgi:Putative adhesin
MRRLQAVHVMVSVVTLASVACSIDVRGEGVVAHEEKRFTVTGDPELSVRTFDGSVQVRSWDRNEVLVEIERRGPDQASAAALVVTAAQEGNRITIEAPPPRDRSEGIHIGSWQGPSVSLIVTAPRKLTITARSGDGSISAENLVGTVSLDSGDGSIRGSRIEGALKAHTGDGSIQISDGVGRVEADSGDGSIELDGRFDTIDVRTGDGSVRVDARDGSAMKNDWTVNTGDGAIRLRIPSNLDAELDAHTGDGRVHVDGIAASARQDGNDDSGTLRTRIGKGGQVLRVRTGDGSIDISR